MVTVSLRLTIGLLLLVATATGGAVVRIITWTEQPGSFDTLALGYPVPIPVETTQPFDGFRTYDALFARHQDLALSDDKISGEVVGTTAAGREIWAYLLSDADGLTLEGHAEPAMMINGGMHAREWQSPEVTTGMIERFAEFSDDRHLYQYLMEMFKTKLN